MHMGRGCFITACALAAVGCKLPSYCLPVSKSLVSCRQTSQQAITAMERGEWAQAEALLAQAVKTCPVDSDARRHYAEALWHRGAQAESLAQLAEAMRLAPEDAEHVVRMGQFQLAQGDYRAALAAADQALSLDVRLAPAWAVRAEALRRQGRSQAALADCHRALSLDPENRELLLLSAEIYRELGQPQRALANLQSLLESYSPGDEPAQPLYLAGLAYAALGRFDDAAESLQAARQRGGPDPEVLYQLATAQLRGGHPDRAEIAAREAVAIWPENPRCRELLDRVRIARTGVAPQR
jgi:tetratricopeptide (TPR) repeat protein